MSLPALEFLDFSCVQPIKGWTKKRILEVFDEHRQLVEFHFEKHSKRLDFLFEGMRTRKAQIAALPSTFDKIGYFDFINGVESAFEDPNSVKKRTRMEWEDTVRTRTGKRTGPKRVASKSPNRTEITVHESEGRLLHPIMEGSELSVQNRPNKQATTQKRRPAVLQLNSVTSTPLNDKVFAVPTPLRTTRSQRVVGTGVKRRMVKPEDTLKSEAGSPIMNPFSISKSFGPRLTAAEQRVARKLYTSLQDYFGL